jgi:hypothetical protein
MSMAGTDDLRTDERRYILSVVATNRTASGRFVLRTKMILLNADSKQEMQAAIKAGKPDGRCAHYMGIDGGSRSAISPDAYPITQSNR